MAHKFFRLPDDSSFDKEGLPKILGKQLGFRIQRKDLYSPSFLEWISAQSNFSDSIRYLIEQEIILNGIRNLGKYIPQERDLEEAIREHSRLHSEENRAEHVAYVNDAVQDTIENADARISIKTPEAREFEVASAVQSKEKESARNNTTVQSVPPSPSKPVKVDIKEKKDEENEKNVLSEYDGW